jgi:hypothetical protein
LTLSSAITATPTATSGFLKLRAIEDPSADDDAYSDGPNDDVQIAKRLPITAAVRWQTFRDTASGISLAYPSFGRPSTVSTYSVTSADGATEYIFDVTVQTAAGAAAPQLEIVAMTSTTSPTIETWFASNIDQGNALSNSGAYRVVLLKNGMRAMADTGTPVPSSYNADGELAPIYAMSGSTKFVVTGTPLGDDSLNAELGASRGFTMAMIRQIIEQMQVP